MKGDAVVYQEVQQYAAFGINIFAYIHCGQLQLKRLYFVVQHLFSRLNHIVV